MKLVRENARFVEIAMNSGEAHGSFSQLGEDSVLWWIFHGKRNGFYVDVGCHNPYRFSNTAVLHVCNGWTGINIDPDERAIEAFKIHRPNDVNLCLGVGSDTGLKEVTIFEEGALNSFDQSVAKNPSFAHIRRETKTINVKSLREILRQYNPSNRKIDFLNVDVEGLDHSVLKSNDWSAFKPDVIAVEAHGFDLHNPSVNETFSLLVDMKYRLISYVGVTCIFRMS